MNMTRMAAIATATTALLWGAAAAADEASETLKEGTTAPSFSMKVLNGKEAGIRVVSLDDHIGETAKKGKKAKLVLVSFFATYCEPCKKELPVLEKLHKLYKDKGLRVFVVSIDKGARQAGGISELVAKHKLTYPVIHDRFQILAKRYLVGKLPYLLLIDPDGKIILVNVGYTEKFTEELVAKVQKVLGVPAKSAAQILGKGH